MNRLYQLLILFTVNKVQSMGDGYSNSNSGWNSGTIIKKKTLNEVVTNKNILTATRIITNLEYLFHHVRKGDKTSQMYSEYYEDALTSGHQPVREDVFDKIKKTINRFPTIGEITPTQPLLIQFKNDELLKSQNKIKDFFSKQRMLNEQKSFADFFIEQVPMNLLQINQDTFEISRDALIELSDQIREIAPLLLDEGSYQLGSNNLSHHIKNKMTTESSSVKQMRNEFIEREAPLVRVLGETLRQCASLKKISLRNIFEAIDTHGFQDPTALKSILAYILSSCITYSHSSFGVTSLAEVSTLTAIKDESQVKDNGATTTAIYIEGMLDIANDIEKNIFNKHPHSTLQEHLEIIKIHLDMKYTECLKEKLFDAWKVDMLNSSQCLYLVMLNNCSGWVNIHVIDRITTLLAKFAHDSKCRILLERIYDTFQLKQFEDKISKKTLSRQDVITNSLALRAAWGTGVGRYMISRNPNLLVSLLNNNAVFRDLMRDMNDLLPNICYGDELKSLKEGLKIMIDTNKVKKSAMEAPSLNWRIATFDTINGSTSVNIDKQSIALMKKGQEEILKGNDSIYTDNFSLKSTK